MNKDDLNIIFSNKEKAKQNYKLQYFWNFLKTRNKTIENSDDKGCQY